MKAKELTEKELVRVSGGGWSQTRDGRGEKHGGKDREINPPPPPITGTWSGGTWSATPYPQIIPL